jgi:hypothetical protein
MTYSRVEPSFCSANSWVEVAIAWDSHGHAGVTMFALSVDAAAQSMNYWVEAAIACDSRGHASVTMFALSVDAAAHWAAEVPDLRELSEMI